MRIPIIIALSALHRSITGEPLITQCASALFELRSALSPCSALRSNPTIISHPGIPNLWIIPHTLSSGSWEDQALIVVGTIRLYTENHDLNALLKALSDPKKITEWKEVIASELGLSSRNPVSIDAEKLEVALDGIQFNAQWISDPSQVPNSDQTVFLITDDTDDVSDAPFLMKKNPDWAVVARIAPDCSIILHSEEAGEAPASLIPRIEKVLAR